MRVPPQSRALCAVGQVVGFRRVPPRLRRILRTGLDDSSVYLRIFKRPCLQLTQTNIRDRHTPDLADEKLCVGEIRPSFDHVQK